MYQQLDESLPALITLPKEMGICFIARQMTMGTMRIEVPR
jgi:hypothetical protein